MNLRTLEKNMLVPVEKKPSDCTRILNLLRSGPQSNIDLSKVTPRYGARLKDLRDDGWAIVTERVSESLYRYTLTGHREDAE